MPTNRLTDMNLSEIMNRWPPTIRVFIDRRMHCVGCPIAPFHTVADAADEHGLDLADLTEELEARAAQGGGRRPA
jgi:hybrid cluster-associated redox disulfide protein